MCTVRMKLADLIPAVRTSFCDGRLTAAHALEIARLQPRDQERALAECFPGHRTTSSILKDRKAEACRVRLLCEWIVREIHLDLKHFPPDSGDVLTSIARIPPLLVSGWGCRGQRSPRV
jgi:ParB family chromosome partitioning protein